MDQRGCLGIGIGTVFGAVLYTCPPYEVKAAISNPDHTFKVKIFTPDQRDLQGCPKTVHLLSVQWRLENSQSTSIIMPLRQALITTLTIVCGLISFYICLSL